MKKIKLLAITIVTALVLTGCSTTKLNIDKSLKDGPTDALLTGMSISINIGGDSLLDAAAQLIGGSELETFGGNATESLAMFLESKGINLYTDATIAKRVELPTLGNMTALGYWNHAEASNYTSAYFGGFTIGFDKEAHISKVKMDDDVNYFIFSDINISKANTIGIFGAYPYAVFTVVIVDQAGEVVLKAKAVGQGKKQFLGVNTSEENLSVALNNAITKLNEL